MPQAHDIKPVETEHPPETVALALDAAADPFATLATIAEKAGLSKTDTMALVERLRAQYQPVLGKLRRVKTSELQDLLDDRAFKLLTHLDEKAIMLAAQKGDIKSLAIALGITLEKRQLLRGEPTHILSVEERQNLDKLIPAIVAEAKRRGFDVEQRGTIIDVTPEEEPKPKQTAVGVADATRRAELRRKDELGEPS